MPKLLKKSYEDYTGGYNDVVTPYMMQDNELLIIENYDIKKSIGGLPLRKGTTALNATSLNGDITRRIEYFLRADSRKVIVLDKKVYFDNAGTLTYLVDVDIDKPHFMQKLDVLYISDNTDLYEYGQKDYFSNVGTVDIETDDIVQVATTHPTTAIRGNFYQAVSNLGDTDLTSEDFTVTANWSDVTDIQSVISNVARPVEAWDPSEKEVLTLTLFDAATKTANIEITLNNVTTAVAITSGDTADQVAAKVLSVSFPGYTKTLTQNVITFTADDAQYAADPVFQPYSTSVSGVFKVVTNGVDDDNQMDEIRKCQRIILHSKSQRYIASGNPENPTTIYFSEIGQINYWKEFNELVPTSSDGPVKAMFNLVSSVLVSYNRTWWEYTGLDPATDGEWKQLPIPFGCESEWTVKILDYSNFVYLAKDGLYVVSSNILTQEGVPTQDTGSLKNITAKKVDNTIRGITDKSMCVAVFDDDIYYLAYNDDELVATNNKILCYFTGFSSFTKYTGLYVNDFLVNSDGDVELASTNFSLLMGSPIYYDVDIVDGTDKPIYPILESTKLTFGLKENRKFFERIHVHFIQTDNPTDEFVNIEISIDNNSIKSVDDVDITPSLVWGRKWGKLWGFQELLYFFTFVRRRGTWIKYRITAETTGLNIEFYGISIEFYKLRTFTPNTLGDPIN